MSVEIVILSFFVAFIFLLLRNRFWPFKNIPEVVPQKKNELVTFKPGPPVKNEKIALCNLK